MALREGPKRQLENAVVADGISASEETKQRREVWVVTNGIRVRHRTMCQPSRPSPKGVNTKQCATKDVRPRRGGVRVSRRLEKGTSANAAP
ncbi:hypothetical protein SDJN02_03007, partial [Cucurbita argyrosperma subsp. argyrosperma]